MLSYGPKLDDCFRRIAWYVARVNSGASPATLPVELPTSFELVINKRAAGAMGLNGAADFARSGRRGDRVKSP